MIETVVFDTKPYDRDHLRPAAAAGSIEWRFLEFRLNRDTVPMAKGAQAVCVFVNERTTVANLVALDSGRPFVEGSVLT
jgi:D-lactate dehydrogenase